MLATSHGVSRFPGLPGLSKFGSFTRTSFKRLLRIACSPEFPPHRGYRLPNPSQIKSRSLTRWRQCTAMHGHACSSLHCPGNACRCQGAPCSAATLAWADSLRQCVSTDTEPSPLHSWSPWCHATPFPRRWYLGRPSYLDGCIRGPGLHLRFEIP